MLQDFEITGDARPPVFRAERPELRIAEDENENSRKKKTERPRVANRGPAFAEARFGENEESGKNDEKSREMMIEFAFLFVREEFGLGSRIRVVIHGHGHAGVIVVSRGILREGDCGRETEKNHGQQKKQGKRNARF